MTVFAVRAATVILSEDREWISEAAKARSKVSVFFTLAYSSRFHGSVQHCQLIALPVFPDRTGVLAWKLLHVKLGVLRICCFGGWDVT